MTDNRHPRFDREPTPNEPWLEQTKLIWLPEEVETHYEQPRNSFCYFRKTFELQGKPVNARLRLFADSRYKLYVNGKYVCRGPCRSDPRWQYFDEADVTGYMAPGKNVIAVLALHYGYNTGQYVHRIPALVAETVIDDEHRRRTVISSDSSWKCCKANAYDRNAPRVNGCQGPVEIYDARNEWSGWTELAYCDDQWEGVKCRDNRLVPFLNWLPRPIPMMEEKEIAADRVVNRGWVTEKPRPVERLHHQMMDEEDFLHLEPFLPTETEYVADSVPSGRASVVTFDFSVIQAGYLQLEVTGQAGAVLDAVYAEELWEGKAFLNLNNNRSFDRFILREGRNMLEIAFGWKAFRYVQFRVRNPQGPVIFHKVGMRTRKYPLARTAEFACSDNRLNALWDISVRTLRLCMQDGFLDSSSREQQQWMGDGRWQAVINACYSGDHRLHRKLLEQIGQSQDCTGMTKSRYPDGHENFPPIPSFCLAWVSSFADYLDNTGDLSLVKKWWPNIVLALRWFSAYENECGLLEDVPYWFFVDRAEAPEGPMLDDQRGGIAAGLNLQYLEALRNAVRFARQFDDHEAAEVYAEKIGSVTGSMKRLLWHEERQAYADCLVDGILSDKISEPTNALAVLHLHDAADERVRLIGRSVFSGESGYRVTAGSPYFMLTIFRAFIKMGNVPQAMELMRRRYGAMLDAGATTIWEGWTLFHKHPRSDRKVSFSSASHAWGASPIVFLLEGVLGFAPEQPGFGQFSLNPKLCGLKYVKASIPAAAGDIRIEIRAAEESGMAIDVDIPDGCTGQVCGTIVSAGKHTLTITGGQQ